MLSSTISSSADAFIIEEVCPLCLHHYAAVDECTCVVCDAPSCPGCAELLDTSGAMRCYACAPVAHVARATVLPSHREPGSPLREASYAARRWLGDLNGGSRWLRKSLSALYRRVLTKPASVAGSVRRSRSLDFAPR